MGHTELLCAGKIIVTAYFKRSKIACCLLAVFIYVIGKVKENKPVFFIKRHAKQLNVPVHSFAILNSCGCADAPF